MLWDILSGVMIKSFQMQHEGEQGISCIFDCRLSPDGTLCAAADGSGYLSLFGLGSSLPYQQVLQASLPTIYYILYMYGGRYSVVQRIHVDDTYRI